MQIMPVEEGPGVNALLSLALHLKARSVNCHSNYRSPLSSTSSLITHPCVVAFNGRDKAINTKRALEFSLTTAAETLINTPWIIRIG